MSDLTQLRKLTEAARDNDSGMQDLLVTDAELELFNNPEFDLPLVVAALLDVAEAAEAELAYKFTDYQRRRHFPKLAHRLDRLAEVSP